MSAPREFVLELFRAERPEDPYGFRMGPQTYLLRHEGGVAEPVRMDWEDGWMRELSGLQASQVPLELRRRLGDRLQRLLAATRWREQQRALDTLGEGETLSLTLRAQAAELLILPWELMTLEGSGLHLGADSRVLLRYEWPGSASVAALDKDTLAAVGNDWKPLHAGWARSVSPASAGTPRAITELPSTVATRDLETVTDNPATPTGDTFTIDEQDYEVAVIRPDNEGITELMMEKL